MNRRLANNGQREPKRERTTHNKKEEIHPLLLSFFPVVDCIAEFLGPNVEVVLHRLSDLEHSIVKIRNGHITGRKVGGSMTDLGLHMINEAKRGVDVVGNYNAAGRDGSLLKCNGVTIRDKKREPIGFICLNMNVSPLVAIERMISRFYDCHEGHGKREEQFGSDLPNIIQRIVDDVINEKHTPVHLMTREDRMDVVSKLDHKGIFFAKGSISRLSRALGVSTPAIYKYLNNLRVKNASGD